jgi:hypothetical protein
MVQYLRLLYPQLQLRSYIAENPQPGSVPLSNTAFFFDYVIVNQRRYHARNRTSSATNSFVEIAVDDNGSTWAGELMDIIHIKQGA